MGCSAPCSVASADSKGALKLEQAFRAVPSWGKRAMTLYPALTSHWGLAALGRGVTLNEAPASARVIPEEG